MRITSCLLVLVMLTTNAFASYTAAPIPVAKGGTGSTSQSNNVAVTTDGSGHIVSTSSTTATEIGYVHSVTSAIQTQLNGKASTALDNIASVALSADLIPATSGSAKLGSAAKPFGDSFLNLLKDASSVVSLDSLARLLKNSSGNAVIDYSGAVLKSLFNLQLMGSSSGSIQISSGATPTAHTVTLPATVCSSGQYWADNGSGVMSCTTFAVPALSVADAGDAAYSILSANGEVRTTTALTAGRAWTLPVCDGSNIGEKHYLKNTPAQTFNVTITAAGSDDVDGAATYVLAPGDAATVICGAFGANGSWDIN